MEYLPTLVRSGYRISECWLEALKSPSILSYLGQYQDPETVEALKNHECSFSCVFTSTPSVLLHLPLYIKQQLTMQLNYRNKTSISG